MSNPNFKRGFEDFWSSLDVHTRKSLGKDKARRAFLAGFRLAAFPKSSDFRFQAGRWRVTVRAPSMMEARVEAIKVLDRRAEKLGAIPPEHGWQLVPVLEQS